jgi:hypothetical protein
MFAAIYSRLLPCANWLDIPSMGLCSDPSCRTNRIICRTALPLAPFREWKANVLRIVAYLYPWGWNNTIRLVCSEDHHIRHEYPTWERHDMSQHSMKSYSRNNDMKQVIGALRDGEACGKRKDAKEMIR